MRMARCLLEVDLAGRIAPIRMRTFGRHDPAQEKNALLLRTIKALTKFFLIGSFAYRIKHWRGAGRLRGVNCRADQGLSRCGMLDLVGFASYDGPVFCSERPSQAHGYRMFKLVLMQVLAASLAIVCSIWWFDLRAAISAMLGAAVVVVPSLVFVGFLKLLAGLRGGPSASAFLLGGAGKMILSLLLLVLVPLLYAGIHWGALMLGLIVTLQANVFAFLVKL